MLLIIAIILNFAALYFIFHYFKWKLTSYNFLEGYEKKKEEIADEINLMIIEINKTTERNIQILEAKINQLNEAASKSEKLFAALRKEKEINENSENIYQKLERKSINDKIEKIGKTKEENKELFPPKQEPELFDNSSNIDNSVKMSREDMREKVITMYKNGIDIELISRNLGITTGEVELIISISKIK